MSSGISAGAAAIELAHVATNLPTPASSFLGREEELYEADRLLQSTRLLTIAGPGGQGKTRFALELARRAREERFTDYSAGVFACFLSSLRDTTLVLPTICQALSVREQPGESALEALASFLEAKRLLLLLDNAEHLLGAAPELAQLLERASGLTLLVTSRELLRIHGEYPYALPPLAQDEGIALFCERARVEPSSEIAELCTRLEGLPLAIELAAARMAILTPAQLLERLSQRLDLLKGTRDADPRQQTLRATIEWSYDLLSVDEQQVFARLSVFAGGCTLEAAEQVCSADLDSLHSLVDKSLLRFSERFWMLETIREFAGERLGESEESELVPERHAEWVATLVQRAEPELELGAQAEWLDHLRREHDNVRRALMFALDRRDTDLAHRLAGATATFWWVQGHMLEGSRWLTDVLALPAPEDNLLRAKALESCAHLIVRQPEHARAKRLAEESAGIYRDLGNASGESRALRVLAIAATRDGDDGTFRALTEESASLARAARDDWVLGMALNNLGNLALMQGDVERARALLNEALELARQRQDRRSECFFLENVALVEFMEGDVAQARASFVESLRIADRLGFLEVIAENLVGVGAIAAQAGELERAALILGGARQLRVRLGLWMDVLEERLETSGLAAVEAGLGRDGSAIALGTGERMSVPQLVSLALEHQFEGGSGK